MKLKFDIPHYKVSKLRQKESVADVLKTRVSVFE